MKHETTHLAAIRKFSLDLHELQKDMRILTTLKWSPEFTQAFLSQTGRPKKSSVRFSYKEQRSAFPHDQKKRDIEKHRARARKHFETQNPDVHFIFNEILDDLEGVSDLLSSVGTHKFGEVSERLWGSVTTPLEHTDFSIHEIAERFGRNLERLSGEETERMFPKILNAEGLASLLRQKLQEAHLIESIKVSVDENLVADAAAGSHYVKIRKGAKFSIKDVDVLLYHEIFTHVVTALNGRAQKHARWLRFDSPRCTSTQEGLAVFLEILAGKTYPRRLRRIIDRILLLGQIGSGETPAHMYDSLREMRYSHLESLNLIMRAYRGCDAESGKPFTKDISYLKGLIECFNFIQANLTSDKQEHVHALFSGKLQFKEIPALVRLTEAGVVQPPNWIPTQFLDLDSLVGWFAYIGALGTIRSPELQRAYREQNKNHGAAQTDAADTRPRPKKKRVSVAARGGARTPSQKVHRQNP